MKKNKPYTLLSKAEPYLWILPSIILMSIFIIVPIGFVFRRMTGDTVIGYLARLRLKTARKLLREGNLSITEIAEELNFSSVHYFTRFFRKHENMSPSEYAGSIRARFEE